MGTESRLDQLSSEKAVQSYGDCSTIFSGDKTGSQVVNIGQLDLATCVKNTQTASASYQVGGLNRSCDMPQLMLTAENSHSVLSALGGVWRAARWRKNLPLCLLLLSGAFASGRTQHLEVLLVALGVLLSSSALMTHINILTDIELDRAHKSYLHEWLNRRLVVTRHVLWAEAVLTCVGIGWLAGNGNSVVGLGLAVFTATTVLYSYNFLSVTDPVGTRWKVSIKGHAAAVICGYTSLWVAGFASGDGDNWEVLVRRMPLFFSASLSEYALFMAESAIDDEDERRSGLLTAAASLGRRRSSRWALGLASAAMGLMLLSSASAANYFSLTLLAFIAPGLWRWLVIALLSIPRQEASDTLLRGALPDISFFGARILTLCLLALA